MKRHSSLKRAVLLGVALSLGGVLSAQRTPDKKLILNGKATSAAVLQMDGHSYLDVEALAQITNGSVRIEPNQIVLTIPNTNFDANTAQPTPALTKDFASAAIATLAEMKSGEARWEQWSHLIGLGWLVGAGLSRTGTGQPGASNGGSVHEFRPQCVAVAQHAVCKPGQMGKHSGCGTPESQWSQNGGGKLIAG